MKVSMHWVGIVCLAVYCTVFTGNASGVTHIEVAPNNASPGTVLTINTDSAVSGGTVLIQFFHGKSIEAVNQIEEFSMRVTDAIYTSELMCGDQNDAPKLISVKCGVPFSSPKESLYGLWTVQAIDTDGSKALTSLKVVGHDSLLDVNKKLLSKTKEQLAELLVGMRGGESERWHLCIMKVEGERATVVFNQLSFEEYSAPQYSPNSIEIAFAARRNGGTWNIHSFITNKGIVREWVAGENDAYSPLWSPDGRQLAFIQGGTVCLIKSPKGDINAVMGGLKAEKLLGWTENNEILFSVYDPQAIPLFENRQDRFRVSWNKPVPVNNSLNRSYYKVSVSTKQLRTVPYHPIYDWLLSLSRDKKKVVFDFALLGQWDIWTMSAEGIDFKKITDDEFEEHEPAWSPDGKEIVFVSNRIAKM